MRTRLQMDHETLADELQQIGQGSRCEVLHISRSGLMIVDAGHRYRYVNQAYKELLSLSADANLAGRHMADVLGGCYEQFARPHIERALRGERVELHLTPPPLPGAEQRYYTISLDPDVDQSGPICVGVLIDVTEQQRTEASLRDRESQLRLANEVADIGTWRYNILTNEIHLDARSQAHYGFEQATVTRDEVLARVHPADIARIVRELAAATDPDGDGCHASEYRVIHPDGSVHWVAVQTYVYFAAHGGGFRPVFGIGTSQDITARKRDEESLRRYADRLSTLRMIDRAILEAQSPEQVSLLIVEYLRRLVPCDRATVLTYDSASDQLRVLAISSSAPVSMSLRDIMPITDSDRHSAIWVRRPWHIADAVVVPSLAHYAEQLERVGVHSLLHIPLFTQGAFIGALTLSSPEIGAFSDEHVELATEVVDQIALALHNARLLAQLQAERLDLALRVKERTAKLSEVNAELARAARLKDEFLTNMSHELRTPLNSILGRAEILREQIYGPLGPQQLDSLRAIDESGRHLLAMINDILDLSKIEAGKIDLDLGPVFISEVIQSAMRMVAQIALQKRINLVYPREIPVEYLYADARRLKQILVNLLSNAVKFTLEGGEVGLDVHRRPAQSQITFTVWDTGVGIAPEDLPRLFKPFSQIDSSLSRQNAGSGLGLALVARLAGLHGGGAQVESTLGVGSRFSVTLPWRDASAPAQRQLTAAAKLPAPSAPAKQPLILVVEDNEVNIELMRDYLMASGYSVAAARNGAEALTCTRELCPALILMDIQMPLIDGLEVTRQIRADSAVRATPIIALTALAMRGDRERCIAAGADAYFSKPVDLRQLGATIASLLRPPMG